MPRENKVARVPQTKSEQLELAGFEARMKEFLKLAEDLRERGHEDAALAVEGIHNEITVQKDIWLQGKIEFADFRDKCRDAIHNSDFSDEIKMHRERLGQFFERVVGMLNSFLSYLNIKLSPPPTKTLLSAQKIHMTMFKDVLYDERQSGAQETTGDKSSNKPDSH